jgi:hypothetical protein
MLDTFGLPLWWFTWYNQYPLGFVLLGSSYFASIIWSRTKWWHNQGSPTLWFGCVMHMLWNMSKSHCLLMIMWYISLQLLDSCCCRGFASVGDVLVLLLPGLWSAMSSLHHFCSTVSCSLWNRHWMVYATLLFLLFFTSWCLCRWTSGLKAEKLLYRSVLFSLVNNKAFNLVSSLRGCVLVATQWALWDVCFTRLGLVPW